MTSRHHESPYEFLDGPTISVGTTKAKKNI